MNKSILLILLISFPLYAYIGPGMAGGAIAAIIGFFAAILLGFWGILYYPIKRALLLKTKGVIEIEQSRRNKKFCKDFRSADFQLQTPDRKSLQSCNY